MDFNQPLVTKSPQETARLGEELGHWVREQGTRAVCLYGELGSGKTTLAQGFAKAFGITSRLLSPTFIIVRRYQLMDTPTFLYHVDLYRAEGEKDLQSVGLPEILADPDCVVLVEWAEKLGAMLPKHRVDVRLKALEDGSHSIWITLNRQ